MEWIPISKINEYKELDNDMPLINILVWQKNLSDENSSRFQRAVFYKGDKKCGGFFRMYPVGIDANHYKEDNQYIGLDLEGDRCQITHFAFVKKPSFK